MRVHLLQVYPRKRSESTARKMLDWLILVDIRLNQQWHLISPPCTIPLSMHLNILHLPRSCRIRNSFTVCFLGDGLDRNWKRIRFRKSSNRSVEHGTTSWCSRCSSIVSRFETCQCLERSTHRIDESAQKQSSESKSCSIDSRVIFIARMTFRMQLDRTRMEFPLGRALRFCLVLTNLPYRTFISINRLLRRSFLLECNPISCIHKNPPLERPSLQRLFNQHLRLLLLRLQWSKVLFPLSIKSSKRHSIC